MTAPVPAASEGARVQTCCGEDRQDDQKFCLHAGNIDDWRDRQFRPTDLKVVAPRRSGRSIMCVLWLALFGNPDQDLK